MSERIKVWDLPTRVFHGLLVLLCVTSVVTVQLDELEWHERSGIAILILVVSRLVWAVIGSETSRFSHFIKGPRAIIRYLAGLWQSRGSAYIGHNPVGGWVVMALLVLLAVQAGSGLFANDEIFFEGPLAKYASRDMSDTLTSIHHLVGETLLIVVGLHVLANLAYWVVLKQNLIVPMFSGFQRSDKALATPLRWRGNWFAIGILAVVAVIVGLTIGYR